MFRKMNGKIVFKLSNRSTTVYKSSDYYFSIYDERKTIYYRRENKTRTFHTLKQYDQHHKETLAFKKFNHFPNNLPQKQCTLFSKS